jgi:hypothetical protein
LGREQEVQPNALFTWNFIKPMQKWSVISGLAFVAISSLLLLSGQFLSGALRPTPEGPLTVIDPVMAKVLGSILLDDNTSVLHRNILGEEDLIGRKSYLCPAPIKGPFSYSHIIQCNSQTWTAWRPWKTYIHRKSSKYAQTKHHQA